MLLHERVILHVSPCPKFPSSEARFCRESPCFHISLITPFNNVTLQFVKRLYFCVPFIESIIERRILISLLVAGNRQLIPNYAFNKYINSCMALA